MKSELRKAREAARLTRKQVADPLSRTTEWLRRIECGSLASSPETREKILRVIETLSTLRAEFQKKSGEALARVILNGKTKHNVGPAERA